MRLPERESDCIEAQRLLSVHDRGKVSDLAEIPRICIVGVESIHHGLPRLKAEPVEALSTYTLLFEKLLLTLRPCLACIILSLLKTSI